MAEAWLLADRANFARYFGVSLDRVPPDPEALPHAKQALLGLVRHSLSAAAVQVRDLPLATCATAARRWSCEPSLDMVALVPITWRSAAAH